ncbi:MAG: 30S ribosomal protein S6 [Candidatus Eisenbacteria bacterium]
MRDYETTIILRTNLEEAEIEKEIKAFEEGITSRGGEMVLFDRWGKRRLAYEIDRQHEGYYVMARYASSAEVPAELERRFRINEKLLRYLTVVAETPRPQPGGSEMDEGAAQEPTSAEPAASPTPAETAPASE